MKKARKKLKLYGVKLLFSWETKKQSPPFILEERILLFKCHSEKELDKLVANEQRVYSSNGTAGKCRIKPLTKRYVIYFIYESEVNDNPLEIYSNLHRHEKSKKMFTKNHLS